MSKPPSATFQLPRERRTAMLQHLRRMKQQPAQAQSPPLAPSSVPHADASEVDVVGASADEPQSPTTKSTPRFSYHRSQASAHLLAAQPVSPLVDDEDVDDACEEYLEQEVPPYDEDEADSHEVHGPAYEYGYDDSHAVSWHQRQSIALASSSSPPPMVSMASSSSSSFPHRSSVSTSAPSLSFLSPRSPLSASGASSDTSFTSARSSLRFGGGGERPSMHEESMFASPSFSSTSSFSSTPAGGYSLVPVCPLRREELLAQCPGATIRELCPVCDTAGARVPIGLHPGAESQPPTSRTGADAGGLSRATSLEADRTHAHWDLDRGMSIPSRARSISASVVGGSSSGVAAAVAAASAAPNGGRASFSLPHTTRRPSLDLPISPLLLAAQAAQTAPPPLAPLTDRRRAVSHSSGLVFASAPPPRTSSITSLTPEQAEADDKNWWKWVHENV